jgi:23S rRNA (adenine-N6)-dimethyltransferase
VAAHGDRWGWHQLDRRWARRLVAAAGVGPGDLVVDVGAGTGVITEALVARGARVVAVELHPRRASLLRDRFADDAVTVVRADASDLRLPRRPFVVVANPPFTITTALLRRLTSPRSNLVRASIVVPMWAATRWAVGRGVGGVTSKRNFAFHRGPVVPAAAFRPPARADAAVLIVERSGGRAGQRLTR